PDHHRLCRRGGGSDRPSGAPFHRLGAAAGAGAGVRAGGPRLLLRAHLSGMSGSLSYILDLRRRYPRYHIARVNTATPAGIALQEEYNRAYHVPKRDQGRIPIAFAGQRYFLGVDAVTKELPAYLRSGPLVRPGRQLRPRDGGRTILTH